MGGPKNGGRKNPGRLRKKKDQKIAQSGREKRTAPGVEAGGWDEMQTENSACTAGSRQFSRAIEDCCTGQQKGCQARKK